MFKSDFATGAGVLLICAAVSPCSRAAIVAHWKFDEAPGSTTAVATVGGINGALAGDAAFVPGGKSGNALSVSIAGGGLVNFGDHFGFVGTTDFEWRKQYDTTKDEQSEASDYAVKDGAPFNLAGAKLLGLLWDNAKKEWP